MTPRSGRPPEPASGLDMIDLLSADHRAVEALFVELESGAGTPQRRQQVTEVAVAALGRHTALEEQFRYPTVREVVDGGDRLADRAIAAHTVVQRQSARLARLGVTDPEFDRLCPEMIANVRRHLAEEETRVFPALRRACADERLVELGTRIRAARDSPQV